MDDWALGMTGRELDEFEAWYWRTLEARMARRTKVTIDGGGSLFPRRASLPAKREMQEATLQRCPECGCSGGRHLRVCSRGGGFSDPSGKVG